MMPESKRPITIEDLLRLKRAERPPAEFWTSFDRELRTKQLAALVAKRPWWQRVPKAFSGLARYRLPLGASAVLAIAFFSFRDYSVMPPAQQAKTPETAVAIQSTPEIAPSPSEADRLADQAAPAPASVTTSQPDVVVAVSAVSDSPANAEIARVALPEGTPLLERETDLPSPAARHIAANLAAVQSSDPVRSRTLLAAVNGFESRVMPARSTVEPLQQITPPSDTRRSRLLTAMVSTASLDTSVRTTERAASRIDEERLYDQIQRFRARGVGGQVKF